MLAHVGDGLSQSGVGLHLCALDLVPQPGFQAHHDRAAFPLVEGQPGLGVHPLPLSPGIVLIDHLQPAQQVLDLLWKFALDLNEPTAGVGQAVGQDGVQIPGLSHGVGGQRIAHLDGG